MDAGSIPAASTNTATNDDPEAGFRLGRSHSGCSQPLLEIDDEEARELVDLVALGGDAAGDARRSLAVGQHRLDNLVDVDVDHQRLLLPVAGADAHAMKPRSRAERNPRVTQ